MSVWNCGHECSDLLGRHVAPLSRGARGVQPRVVWSNADPVCWIGVQQLHVDGVTQHCRECREGSIDRLLREPCLEKLRLDVPEGSSSQLGDREPTATRQVGQDVTADPLPVGCCVRGCRGNRSSHSSKNAVSSGAAPACGARRIASVIAFWASRLRSNLPACNTRPSGAV